MMWLVVISCFAEIYHFLPLSGLDWVQPKVNKIHNRQDFSATTIREKQNSQKYLLKYATSYRFNLLSFRVIILYIHVLQYYT